MLKLFIVALLLTAGLFQGKPVQAANGLTCPDAAKFQIVMVNIGDGSVLKYGAGGLCVVGPDGSQVTVFSTRQNTLTSTPVKIPVTGSVSSGSYTHEVYVGYGYTLKYSANGYQIVSMGTSEQQTDIQAAQ
jgi:hypothetical protein